MADLNLISEKDTVELAKSIGKKLKGGEVIELIGDVGAGKTTFVRGLAAGAGSTDRVSSPTFTVSKEYKTPKLTIHHYDFYRLDDLEVIRNELAETLEDPKAVAVLEWAEEMRGVFRNEPIRIRIVTISENERRISIEVPNPYSYIEAGK